MEAFKESFPVIINIYLKVISKKEVIQLICYSTEMLDPEQSVTLRIASQNTYKTSFFPKLFAASHITSIDLSWRTMISTISENLLRYGAICQNNGAKTSPDCMLGFRQFSTFSWKRAANKSLMWTWSSQYRSTMLCIHTFKRMRYVVVSESLLNRPKLWFFCVFY